MLSLSTVLNTAAHRLLEMGKAWPARMRRHMSFELRQMLETIETAGDLPEIMYVLIYLCPGNRSVEGFLAWLATLSPGDLYELVAPYVSRGLPLSRDLGGFRDRTSELMRLWDRDYFSTVEPGILSALEASARYWAERAQGADPAAVVEAASGGVVLDPEADLETVLLVPQYHMRPWNTYTPFRNLLIDQYPAEVPETSPGDPSPAFLRFVQALSDVNRLRILRHLAGGPRTFTEIVRLVHQPKSTVHYHMVVLRAAGLVRVHSKLSAVRCTGTAGSGSFAGADRYSLRRPALAEHWQLLQDYLAQKGDDTK